MNAQRVILVVALAGFADLGTPQSTSHKRLFGLFNEEANEPPDSVTRSKYSDSCFAGVRGTTSALFLLFFLYFNLLCLLT